MTTTVTLYTDQFGLYFSSEVHIVLAHQSGDRIEAWYLGHPDSPEPDDDFEHHALSVVHGTGTWGECVRPVDLRKMPGLTAEAVWEEDGRLRLLQPPKSDYFHPVRYYMGLELTLGELAAELAPRIRRVLRSGTDPERFLHDLITRELTTYGEWPALAEWADPGDPDGRVEYLVTYTAAEVIRDYFDPGWERAFAKDYEFWAREGGYA
ncbi:hypothetical protein HNP84_001234 [Thermocatellispora tengchongensis]|uniref:Uncharacterized protein n=1 Tax=Thermocatellispora tengchongensis TaxID=1073253 RepID=A0A840NVH0_9ACTN|nr:hypothetical protein [Thermocatellispora tengchongensis]MBB5131528.1 hypothetical protein [Thermocatellispora tengchongensis]